MKNSVAERAEEVGKRGDVRPVRNKAVVLLRTAEEEMHRWREHFQTVLNHEEPLKPPEVEPNDELNIRPSRITRIQECYKEV